METLIVTLPLILIAFARVVEASAVVVLAFRRDAPLQLGEQPTPPGRRLRLRAMMRSRSEPAGP